jgi:3-dehydroquinate synthase II
MKEMWLLTESDDWEETKTQITDAIELGFSGVIASTHHDKIKKLGKIKVYSKNSDEISFVEIRSSEDQKKAIEQSKEKEYLFLEFKDWKVIPLENLIAMKGGAKLIVKANSLEFAKLSLETLEKGADGIIVEYKNRESLKEFSDLIQSTHHLELVEGEIVEVKELGMGDRVCIDTVTIMEVGEGMLVGNLSKFMFLIASESEESEYVESRPFRVNAGSVNAYLKVGDKTRYLSELKAGDEVEIVRFDGRVRKSFIGRVKIEKRPMLMIKAKVNDEEGSIILQNAETIKLMRLDGTHISVTSLKRGDKVLVWMDSGKGRHFGTKVEEFIIER